MLLTLNENFTAVYHIRVKYAYKIRQAEASRVALLFLNCNGSAKVTPPVATATNPVELHYHVP
jgi:hypothetical protein